jgi:small-conductance mechanosensitive channel
VLVNTGKHITFAATALVANLLIFGAWPQAHAQNNPSDDNALLLQHLNAVIDWYKHLTTRAQIATEPSDTIYFTNAENLSAQVVRLAFQSARAQAELLAKPTANANNPSAPKTEGASGTNSNVEKYAQYETQVSARIADDESQIAALKEKYGKTGHKDLLAQQQSLEGKLELDKATLSAIQQLKSFAEQTNAGGKGLIGSINELARSVPEVLQPAVTKANTNTPSPAAKTPTASRSGLLGQLMDIYDEMQNIRWIEQLIGSDDSIKKVVSDLRVPLRTEMTNTLNQEKDLSTEKGVTEEQYAALAQRFKQLSAALVPLSEEVLVLDQSESNLVQWREAHTAESREILVSILSRVALIVISVGVVLALAEVWRRLTFKYVRDPRRRRQFLLVRRFVMGFLIFLVLVLGFASEFSSLATFAGFVTAGIAVGLQTILLSVAAYFFVIGRYGISVGDRISVGGVTGDVIDVGLVRFYLMEYASTGVDLYPTGRVVVFPNSILFQAATPLFKQLPGTRYTWHEIAIPLAAKADYSVVQKAVEQAISSLYKEYKLDNLWHRSAFDLTELALNPPTPEHRLQFSDTGPELIVRYPVDLNRAIEIDDKLTKALMDAIHGDPALASAVASTPKIRAIVKT